jgi:hypothetical protein
MSIIDVSGGRGLMYAIPHHTQYFTTSCLKACFPWNACVQEGKVKIGSGGKRGSVVKIKKHLGPR